MHNGVFVQRFRALLISGLAPVLAGGLAVAVAAEAPTLETPPPRPPIDYPAPPPPSPSPPGQRAVQKSGEMTPDDYPIASLREEEEGITIARYTIAANGRVSTCAASGATPRLDARTCEIIKQRWVYSPARDAKGKATASFRTQRITWRIPDDPDDPWSATARLMAKSYDVKFALVVDTGGKVVGCKVEALTSDAERDRFICALASDQWTFPIARDDKGRPEISVRTFGKMALNGGM